MVLNYSTAVTVTYSGNDVVLSEDGSAFGAGWTDPGRQQPVGDTGRH